VLPWLIGRCLGAAVLLGAAAAKARRPKESQAALSAFGIRSPAPQRAAFAALLAIEVGLAAGLIAGAATAAYLAGALMLVFAAALTIQIARGRAGSPCGCFGARSKVGWPGVARNVALGALLLALPATRDIDMATTGWLGLGLAVALACIAGLTVALLALAREVGALRLAIGPQAALEIPHEGPEVGSRAEAVRGLIEPGAEADLGLAVFTSEGCAVCQTLEPVIEFVARDPRVAVRLFDERRDAAVWRSLDVPGSPFAVALDPADGTVLAKGTFNSLGQLESVLATADSRREMARA
jgi:hypothetical protein